MEEYRMEANGMEEYIQSGQKQNAVPNCCHKGYCASAFHNSTEVKACTTNSIAWYSHPTQLKCLKSDLTYIKLI